MQRKDTSWIILKIHTCNSQYMVRAVWCPSGRKQSPLVRIWEMPHPQLTLRQYALNAHIAVFFGSPKGALPFRCSVVAWRSALWNYFIFPQSIYTIIKKTLVIKEWNMY